MDTTVLSHTRAPQCPDGLRTTLTLKATKLMIFNSLLSTNCGLPMACSAPKQVSWEICPRSRIERSLLPRKLIDLNGSMGASACWQQLRTTPLLAVRQERERMRREVEDILNAARVPVIVLIGTRNGATLLYPALCSVRSCGQASQIREECRRLAYEQPHGRQELERPGCCAGRVRWTDDGT